jgi:hypothetical protein
MFFRTLRILGIYYRIYSIKKHWVILHKDKAIFCYGPVTESCIDYVTAIFLLLKLYRDVISSVAFAAAFY